MNELALTELSHTALACYVTRNGPLNLLKAALQSTTVLLQSLATLHMRSKFRLEIRQQFSLLNIYTKPLNHFYRVSGVFVFGTRSRMFVSGLIFVFSCVQGKPIKTAR